MREVTLMLDDEGLLTKVEAEAALLGRSLEEVVMEALEEWLADARLDEQELVEIDSARREWTERGGVEAHQFFDRLRREKGSA